MTNEILLTLWSFSNLNNPSERHTPLYFPIAHQGYLWATDGAILIRHPHATDSASKIRFQDTWQATAAHATDGPYHLTIPPGAYDLLLPRADDPPGRYLFGQITTRLSQAYLNLAYVHRLKQTFPDAQWFFAPGEGPAFIRAGAYEIALMHGQHATEAFHYELTPCS